MILMSANEVLKASFQIVASRPALGYAETAIRYYMDDWLDSGVYQGKMLVKYLLQDKDVSTN